MSNEIRSNLYKVVDNTRMPANGEIPAIERKTPTVKEKIKPFITTPLRGLRWLIFYVLMWLRPILQLITRIIAIPALIGAGLGFVIGDTKHAHIPYIMLAVSFSAFLIGWFYDSLILKISPQPIILT